MGKIVDGVELLRMIRDEEIDEKEYIYIITEGKYKEFRLFFRNKVVPYLSMFGKTQELFVEDILTMKINIETNLDKDIEYKEIDIQSIEEMEHDFHETGEEEEIKEKINELVKAIKQLDKKIKGDE